LYTYTHFVYHFTGGIVNYVTGVSREEAAGEVVPFLVRVDEAPDSDTMTIFRRGDGETGVSLIPVDALRANLARTSKTFRKAFEEFSGDFGALQLNEVQVGLEISATGGVHLIGTAGVKGAITLIFRDLKGAAE
jgi:hypothetical protein